MFKTFALEVYAELLNATLSSEALSLSENMNGQLTVNSYRIVLPSIGLHGEL